VRRHAAARQTNRRVATNPALADRQVRAPQQTRRDIFGHYIDVAVRDPYWHPSTPRKTKNPATVMVNVAMYNIVTAVRGERTAEISRVAERTRGMQAWDDVSA
jgi:hypothetical protein